MTNQSTHHSPQPTRVRSSRKKAFPPPSLEDLLNPDSLNPFLEEKHSHFHAEKFFRKGHQYYVELKNTGNGCIAKRDGRLIIDGDKIKRQNLPRLMQMCYHAIEVNPAFGQKARCKKCPSGFTGKEVVFEMKEKKERLPTDVLHPGQLIQEKIQYPYGLNCSELSRILKTSSTNITRLIDGEIALSKEMAYKIEIAFPHIGFTMEYLMGVQAKYDKVQLKNEAGKFGIIPFPYFEEPYPSQ